MELKTLHDITELKGKKVLVRVDFNVPFDAQGNVVNDKRMRHTLPTLRYLLNNVDLEEGVEQIILITHVGRPKGNEEHLKTDGIARHLAKLLNQPVDKVDDWGESGLPDAKIIMLENVRFHPFEKSKDEAERDMLGKTLANLADLYVNEAFSNSHRSHATMTSIPKYLPSYAGIGVTEEVSRISQALQKPEYPLVAVIGGLKADKLNAIHNLLNIADYILVAGALGYNLRKMQGYDIGATKVDHEGLTELADLVNEVNQSDKVHLPVDAVVADAIRTDVNSKIVSIDHIDNGYMALDIGPETIKNYLKYIDLAKMILWFGPIGAFEIEPFANGTQAIGEAIANSDAISIVGGGDSANAVSRFGLRDKMTLVSTGGGASLVMIEGKELPALVLLKK